MLKVCNVTKKYGELTAVDNLSFEVEEGEIFGLLGLNGAGKTTTFRMILGLLDDYTGNIYLDDKKIDYSITDKIGFLTEERSLLLKLTVLEQIKLYGILKGMEEDIIYERLDYYLKLFGISEYKNKKIKELSKGNQQKIQFISAIINKPKLLILDEPFTGLDPINVGLLKNAVWELQKGGTSIIFSSHQMEYIEDFCEKLIILEHGKSIINGELAKIKKEYAKMNIIIKGDIDVSIIKKVKGVINVEVKNEEYLVNVINEDVIKDVFNAIKNNNITKYIVSEASLNEIFIHYVGSVK